MEDRILKTPAMTICGASFRPREGKRGASECIPAIGITTTMYEECGNRFFC